jgi:ParB/RepB/Spo0J family partition protein
MIQIIQLANLHADPRSANRMAPDRLEKLIENIRHTGKTQPLTVRSHPDEKDHYIIVDGHYRKIALEQLEKTEVSCDVWDITEEAAALLLATLNRLRGEDHPHKRAELFQELLVQYDQNRLSQLLPENTSEIDELLLLLKTEEMTADKLRRQMEEEARSLPVLLNFVLAKSEAEKVEAVLKRFDEDLNLALVKLCEEVSVEKEPVFTE